MSRQKIKFKDFHIRIIATLDDEANELMTEQQANDILKTGIEAMQTDWYCEVQEIFPTPQPEKGDMNER